MRQRSGSRKFTSPVSNGVPERKTQLDPTENFLLELIDGVEWRCIYGLRMVELIDHYSGGSCLRTEG